MTTSSSDQTASTVAPEPVSHAVERSRWRGSARARARLSRQSGFWAVAFSFLAVSAFSTAPSALYGLYAHRDHLSSLTITIVYAVYAGGIVASLMLAGHVSDWYGRRAVLLPTLGVAVLALIELPRRLTATQLAGGFGLLGAQALTAGAGFDTRGRSGFVPHGRRISGLRRVWCRRLRSDVGCG